MAHSTRPLVQGPWYTALGTRDPVIQSNPNSETLIPTLTLTRSRPCEPGSSNCLECYCRPYSQIHQLPLPVPDKECVYGHMSVDQQRHACQLLPRATISRASQSRTNIVCGFRVHVHWCLCIVLIESGLGVDYSGVASACVLWVKVVYIEEWYNVP